MKNKIAIFLPNLGGGGAERAMINLANALAGRGITIDLVLAKAEGEYLAEVSSKVRIVNLNAIRFITCIPALISYMRKERPISMLSVLNYANVLSVFCRIISQVDTRLILSERNNVTLPQGIQRTLKEKIIFSLMKFTYPYSDGVVAVSNGVADDLAHAIGLNREKISVIHNPVVTDSLYEKSDEPLEHPWFEPGQPPVILGVGRLTLQKDFATLINAFALARRKQHCRLIILGEGELRSELENLVMKLGISEDVMLPGFTNNPFPWMKKSSLFVLSSRWEGLPNALIQAMACGTPVISTDCTSGPREILENGVWGSLVEVGNSVQMHQEIINTLNNIDYPQVQIRASHFNENRASDSYEKLLLLNM